MFRKMVFALAATTALGAAALAPTTASAFGGHFGGPHFAGPHFFGPHHFGPRWGWGFGIGAGLVGGAIVADGCLRREVFDTPYGPQVRWVNICY
jgi:hypothetical protein